MTETNESKRADYKCPTHHVALTFLLRGGSGYCRSCRAYVQADGLAMPALTETVRLKREQQAPKPRRVKTENQK